ncbi:MAG TPA: type II toxin-antitoxin system mRNA interferase toxin, RelE/StbE family [Chloroflexi bacterium]|nr:type II toxin-antitoxin system mRNA interferase toxin, RelE/StbE family [Chloroflexota bacterium]HHW87127.1 type II toxin-antitoxin system YafQ family toxin [Chloroflexota bacterium]
MLTPTYTRQFERDLKLMLKRGKDPEKLKLVMTTLINEEPLPLRHRDHALVGNYRDRRECHVEPDWLLIYKTQADEIIFERTGSHSDLFR